MDVTTKILVLILLSIFKRSSAQYTYCDGTTTLASGQTTNINWPNVNKTWCGYIIKAPVDHYLKATLYINMKGTEPDCGSNYVAISKDNMLNWDGYSYFCGYRSGFVVTSIGNELKFGIAADDYTQRVQISIQAVQLKQGDCQCSWNPQTRIVKGQNAGTNEFTSHVTFNGKNSNFCGGTLITQYHAITAAHCAININNVYGIGNVAMHVGRYNIRKTTSTDDSVYAAAYALSSAEAHASYNNPQNANDIGIVRTVNYVRLTRGVSPACVPFSYTGYTLNNNTPLVAVGFGSTEFGLGEDYDQPSWILQKVNLKSNSGLASDCGSTVICANGDMSGYFRGDTCTRDSGGGVYAYMKSRPYIFGVISRGLDCGGRDSFSYNMYVVSYISWIQSKIGSNFLCNY